LTSDRPSGGSACEIALAARGDIAGMLDLQELNLRERGGTLTVRFSRAEFEAALSDSPVIVARKGGALVGYLISSSKAGQAHVPIIQAMLAAYPGGPDSYLYGPVCVAESARGRGLAAAMLAELRRHLPGREGITFIRRDNAASLRAHTKIGMREVAEFCYGDAAVVVVAYRD
jgi:ribosomal protein S18 acetylase RimI-like enzyme